MDLHRAVRAASVGELAWLRVDGRPRAAPVTPLLLDGQPAVAYPYASAALAREVAAAPVVALLVTDDRMTGRGWRPLAASGRPRLVEDHEGELVRDRLLGQELRKYPPARALADSPLLRREHWWYIPRLVVTIEVTSVEPLGAREGGSGEVLAVAAGGQLAVDTVRRAGDEPDRVRVASLAAVSTAGGTQLRGPAAGGEAVLFGHDFSVPDLERWTPWTTRGRFGDGVVTVAEHPRHTSLEPPPGLWRRLRRQYTLERGCRRALAQVGG